MNYTIFDTRGLLLHAYHRSQRKTIETVEGFIPSWQDGLAEFMDEYLKPVLKTCAPRQILACFDGGNNARRRMYIGYKAKRSQRDRDENPVKSEQIKLLLENGRRLLAYLGCRTLHVPGEEADDLIALLVDKIEADGFTIYTRDADLLQLASDKIFVSRMGKLYGLTEFAEQTFDGVPFDLIVLMKAIVGDSSDEYPGVAGCGPKFFENLMETYGVAGLRQIRDWVVSGERSSMGVGECKLLNKLADNWPDLIKFYQVAKVDGAHCYGSLDNKRKQPEWYVRVPNRQNVAGILQAIEPVPTEWEAFFPSERLMDGNMAGYLEQVAKDILASPIVSYDYETSDKTQHGPFREYDKNYVDVLSQELTSVSINYGANLERTIYVPFDHAQTANLTKEWAIWLLSVLSAVQPRAVVQNAAFELAVTARNLGIPLKAPFDTAIMAMYVDENEENGLKAMSQAWLNYKQATYKEVTQGRMMCELTAQEALSYGCDDSLVTGHLFDVFRHIMQMEGSWAFYAANEVDWAVDSTHYFLDGTDIDFDLLDEKYQDAKRRVKAGLEAMHAGLAEHCNAKQTQESAHAAATLLLNEWWVMEKAKAEKKPETMQAAYQALWENAWNGCFYTPPTRRVEVKFAPTAAQLTAVALMIDKALPRISKVSAPGIEEWEAEAVSALDVAKKSRPVDPLAREFVDRLYAARKNLSAGKRQGSGYVELESFCLSVLEERGNHKAILSGDQLNTNSTVQMQTLLYGKLGLPLRRRSKVAYGSTRKKMGVQGGPATGLKAIQAAFVHDVQGEDWRKPILESYLDVAKVSQEISLYYESYPLLVHPIDRRIHPQIRNCGTVTRRPSGTAPNVLQVAKGPLRTVFRAGDYGDGERVMVCADFASQEILLLACESRDPVMLSAFMSTPRLDLHSMTASGFAHVVMPRLGVPVSDRPDYNTFMSWLHNTDNQERAAAAKATRNKYAKACIAEGSLVLTDRGLVPIEDVLLTDLVWDGVEWVRHEGVIFKGYREVLTYDGLTATPDHVVYIEDGSKLTLSEAIRRGATLGIGENKGEAASYPYSGQRNLDDSSTSSLGKLHYLRGSLLANSKQYLVRSIKVLLGMQESLSQQRGQATHEQVFSNEVTMLLSFNKGLQVLRGTRNRAAVRFVHGVPKICKRTPAYGLLQRTRDRQDRQQRTLRAGEFASSQSLGELWEYAKSAASRLFRDDGAYVACLAPTAHGFPGDGIHLHDNHVVASQRAYSPADSEKKEREGRERVYDIVNAGPRHRFTVSGKVVANCNFGIAYGAGPSTLAENLLIPLEFAKELMEGVFTLYNRIRPWQQETTEFAMHNGYTLTAFGNKRHAPSDLWASDKGLASRAARQVNNAVIQSTAADILKIVLTEMSRREMRQRYRLKALKPVYDEISASVPIDLVVPYTQELVEIMSITPPGYPVGMAVDLSIGRTWGSVEEVGGTDVASVERILAKL